MAEWASRGVLQPVVAVLAVAVVVLTQTTTKVAQQVLQLQGKVMLVLLAFLLQSAVVEVEAQEPQVPVKMVALA